MKHSNYHFSSKFYCIILMITFLFTIKGYTQNAHFRLRISQDVGIPLIIDGNNIQGFTLQFNDTALNTLFSNYTVYLFEKEFPTARTPRLQNVYEVISNDIELMYNLITNFGSIYTYGNEIPEPILTSYTPNDYNLTVVLTNLDLIRAEEAWGITTGDPNIIIGITDTEFDLTHPDLSSQIIQSSGTNGTYSHGTSVAGCVAAATDNGVGISGIGFNCKLIVSTSSTYNQMLLQSQAGARVLNASWLNRCSFDQAEQDVIDEIFENGTVVVAGAGNGLNPNGTPRSSCCTGGIGSADCGHQLGYPASYNHVISVSSVGHAAEYGYIDPIYGKHNWKDVHRINADDLVDMHTHNVAVDICAPGYNVPALKNPALNFGSLYGGSWGTSFSSPTIAGVCGLILSVNPCLQPNGVEDILKATAVNIDNIPENAPYAGLLGAGRADAYEAVKAAQATYSATLDLYTKDSYNDFGVEPNVTTTYPWLSEDIWVRNQADGLTNQTHQNPEHSSTNDPNQLNYVYVRVRNKSCVASGSETLDLHWAKASTSLNYPANWNGTTYLNPPTNTALAGNLISSQTIPAIPAGGEVILEFTWNPPSPSDYSFNSEPGHFCLLSKIVSTADPITPYTAIGAYVTENNNVAWKNLTVVDNIPGIIVDGDCPQDMMQNIGVAVMVANTDNIASTFDIKFSVPQEELSNPITTEGKVTIALDEQLYEKWKQGGKKGIGITEIKSPPMSENGANNNNINDNAPITISNRKLFEITGTSSSFDNITLAPNEVRTTSLMVTYPTNPVSDKKLFNYDIIQKRSETGELIGGVRYAIQKPNCSNLVVDAGSNQIIKRGCSAALVAFSSSPLLPALGKDCSSYQWFDDSGKLISEQSAVKITPNTTTTYTLKFTSTSGCTGEDQVTITVLNQLCKKEKEIIKITPNPANDFITIDYKALNTNNAHIRLLKTDNSIDRTYPLDLQNTQKTINVADCNFGSYVMMLVCDGVNEDSEIVIIQ